jgi:hypothetical protein
MKLSIKSECISISKDYFQLEKKYEKKKQMENQEKLCRWEENQKKNETNRKPFLSEKE